MLLRVCLNPSPCRRVVNNAEMSLFYRMSITAGSPQSVWISAAISCLLSNQSSKKMIQGTCRQQNMSNINLPVSYLEELLSFDCSDVVLLRLVYLFAWDPHRDVSFTVHRDSQYNFLPEWYVKEMKSPHSSRS